MAGSRSLAVFGLLAALALASEDADEVVIGELYSGPARTDHPGWDPISRKRGAQQPVRPTAVRPLPTLELLLCGSIRSGGNLILRSVPRHVEQTTVDYTFL